MSEHRIHADSPTEAHHEPRGPASPHGSAGDVPGHEPEDPAGHDEDADALGPIEVRAWAAGAAGVLLGLVVVACLVVATGGLGL